MDRLAADLRQSENDYDGRADRELPEGLGPERGAPDPPAIKATAKRPGHRREQQEGVAQERPRAGPIDERRVHKQHETGKTDGGADQVEAAEPLDPEQQPDRNGP